MSHDDDCRVFKHQEALCVAARHFGDLTGRVNWQPIVFGTILMKLEAIEKKLEVLEPRKLGEAIYNAPLPEHTHRKEHGK